MSKAKAWPKRGPKRGTGGGVLGVLRNDEILGGKQFRKRAGQETG